MLEPAPSADPAAVLAVRGLHKRYGALTALQSLDLELGAGEIYGLLGPNGAGKTTALRLICGLLRADAGSGRCLAQPLGRAPRGLGYMPQRGGLYDDLSVAENLRFYARAQGLDAVAARVAAALGEHGLTARAQQRVGTLSGGWRQRLALAAALLHAPRLLLLDEPSAGLDPAAREALWTTLRAQAAQGAGILVTTHYADEAERCDRIGYLRAGTLQIEGAPARLAAQLGLQVRGLAADGGAAPAADWLSAAPAAAACVIRDGEGWRWIARQAPPPGLPPGVPALPRLGDALSWLSLAAAGERAT